MLIKLIEYVPAVPDNPNGPELFKFRCKCGYEFAEALIDLLMPSMQKRQFECRCKRTINGALLRSLSADYVRKNKIGLAKNSSPAGVPATST